MSIILDPVSGGGATEETNLIISAGSDRKAFVATFGVVFSGEAVGRTSVTAGGVSMTLLDETSGVDKDVYVQIWYIDEPDITSMVGNNLVYSGGIAGAGRTSLQWTIQGSENTSITTASILSSFVFSTEVALTRGDNSITFAVGATDSNGIISTLTNPASTSTYSPFAIDIAYGDQVDSAGTSNVGYSSSTQKDRGIVAINIAPTLAGPTITGPDSTTEGAVTVQTGTLQDTVVTQSLISGSYSIEQTINSATATELEYVAESGVNLCTPSTPVAGVPLQPTIAAAGITPYVVQQKADDGTNPPSTRNITLNPEATHEVIQTMIAVANTTPDQSIFGSTWVTVEDNHQARLPKVVDGVTFTWNDKGEFTTDIDKTVTFQYELFSPASGNWSAIDLTVRGTVILNRTFRVKMARRVIGF